jgi:hypothetical protein
VTQPEKEKKIYLATLRYKIQTKESVEDFISFYFIKKKQKGLRGSAGRRNKGENARA